MGCSSRAARRRRSLLGALGVGALVACGVGGCGRAVQTSCNGIAADICSQSVEAAVASLPSAVRSRQLTAAFVQAGDPADPKLCGTWGLCERADAVWVVVLTYGDENWPVLAVRRAAGGTIEAAKPFDEPTAQP